MIERVGDRRWSRREVGLEVRMVLVARGRGRRWLLGAVGGLEVSGWLVRRGAAHAHTGLVGVGLPTTGTDPAELAAEVRVHAARAGVNPVLVMAILYNESYKPHVAVLERAWQLLHRDSAFGVANMHRGTYERVRRGRPFAGRPWKALPGDGGLAVQAAAWHLRDLAARLPDRLAGAFTEDELLAMGYNSGARNMLRFARGTRPGPQARAYLERLRTHWAEAERALTRK